MKNFFYIVFGGLLTFLLAVILWYGLPLFWDGFIHVVNNSVTIDGQNVDPNVITTVFGFYKQIRYSANEEEDMINNAASSLPNGDVKTVTAKAYIVKDLINGKVALSKNADNILPIASVTKLVTAVVARRLIPTNTRITLDKREIGTFGNTADLTAGETFSAGDLLYPLLMVSSNDAAEAFAQSYGRAKFIQAMNDFVQNIGAYKTSFSDPSGLDPKNVSSASDMALILDWIKMNDPFVIDITTLKIYTVRSHSWTNPTHFLSWSYYVGGKNGLTDEAGNTAASLFSIGTNKDIYAIILLGSLNRDTDMIKLLKEAQK